jgi:hypothetical protein
VDHSRRLTRGHRFHGLEESETSFIIRDILAPDQKSEDLTVYINGNSVGTLKLDRNTPAQSITVTVPAVGSYSYAVIGEGDVFRGTGVKRLGVVGQGTIDVSRGKVFAIGVKGIDDDNTVELVLNPM